ncbi:MAG: hypothetical protein K2K55_03880, partial [Duncaniella sp.]|nr:hypothetical protein [Duncaniella sp.]
MNRLLEALLSVLVPEICILCDTPLLEGEKHLCLNCLAGLPWVECHAPFSDNPLTERLLSHRAPLVRGATMMRYERGGHSAKLIHDIKYNSRPAAASVFIDSCVPDLMSEGFFAGIDYIIPVPLHWTRRLRRGYSQTEYIADLISKYTGIPVSISLIAPKIHSTQTRLT